MARRWREWEERQITGQHDEFLISELEEKIEEWMLPWLRALTQDDNEFNRHAAEIWDEVFLLRMAIQGRWTWLKRWLRYG